jgi:hypothetical protein
MKMADIVIVSCKTCGAHNDQERDGHFAQWVVSVVALTCHECSPQAARHIEIAYGADGKKYPPKKE